MKKIAILTYILAFSLLSYGQRKRETLSKVKIKTIEANHSISYKISGGDTLKYVYIGFQNMKYSTIIDRKSIMLGSEQAVTEFKNDLISALPELKNKSTINWNKSNYEMNVYDFTNTLYLSDKNGTGYTQVSYKDLQKLITWLDTIKF